MLPCISVRADMDDIAADMNAHGYPLKAEWFALHFEFRFPVYGRVEHGGVEWSCAVRWFLACDGRGRAAGGTVRFVDSRSSGCRSARQCDARPPYRHRQRTRRADDRNRNARRDGRGVRKPAPWGGAALAASHDRAAWAAAGRDRRYVVASLAWRLHSSCRPSRRAQLRDLPGQFPTRPRGRLARFEPRGLTTGPVTLADAAQPRLP